MFQRFKRKSYVIDKISQTCKDFRDAAMAFCFLLFWEIAFLHSLSEFNCI